MKVKIITLFPELFPGVLGASLVGRALQEKIWELEVFNLRDSTEDKHKTVDDSPYGGGSGMVMRADILAKAIEDISDGKVQEHLIIYPTPRGELLNQKKTVEISRNKNIILVLGRYEGIDQRVIDKYNILEISIGDYVLSGGEIAAFAIIDSMVRTLPNVLGNKNSLEQESFAVDSEYKNLLEYPLYTRPDIWNGLEVPAILKSGNHKKIAEWQFLEAQKITRLKRPDLWSKFKQENKND